jgi:hypothetical protein
MRCNTLDAWRVEVYDSDHNVVDFQLTSKEDLLALVLSGAISDRFGRRQHLSQLCHVAVNSSHARAQ